MKHLMEKLEHLLALGGIEKGHCVSCDLRRCGYLQPAEVESGSGGSGVGCHHPLRHPHYSGGGHRTGHGV